MPKSEGDLVLDILTVYRLIEAYKNKHPEDKEVANHYWSDFRGFDGTNESEYLSFTEFLIHKQGKFSEQLQNKNLPTDFNSHSAVLSRYRQMVAVWKQADDRNLLSREDILKMLGD
jgi:hypothetical protein